MTSITTRAGKGTPLTHTEVDDNFTNLNADKLEASNNLSDVSSASAARTNLGLGTAATTASTDYATAAQGALADSAVQPNDSPSFGSVTVSGTVDGRDVAADGSKLDGIEAGANVTDTANVTAAGALMDSEVTNLAQVKAFSSTDYATAAQGALADSAVQPTDLATVATSGSYNDLADKPTIPAAYTSSDVDTHLNTGTATTDQVLAWNGTDYDWADAGGGAPSTADVLAATAGASAGAVGTYAYLIRTTSKGTIVEGSTYAGSGLRYSAGGPFQTLTNSYRSNYVWTAAGGTVAGTWRALGAAGSNAYAGVWYNQSLFLRIS